MGPSPLVMDASMQEANRGRFGEPLKFLPVLFVAGIIASLYMIYVFYHCDLMLQWELPAKERDQPRAERGFQQIIVFHCVTGMLIMCYILSILTHPGQIPEGDPAWEAPAQDMRAPLEKAKDVPVFIKEAKRSGERRTCKWCGKYKPDRCHHCRVCRTCILKMDHHCPWLYNCVGFRNHKYFFLLLFYTAIDCNFMAWTMRESMARALDPETPFLAMFFLLFGETLSSVMGLLASAFFCFHIWLAMNSMTTIEFCEKSLKKVGYHSSAYNRGPFGNIQAVLGPNPLFWLLPWSLPKGDGLNFVGEDTQLIAQGTAGSTFGTSC